MILAEILARHGISAEQFALEYAKENVNSHETTEAIKGLSTKGLETHQYTALMVFLHATNKLDKQSILAILELMKDSEDAYILFVGHRIISNMDSISSACIDCINDILMGDYSLELKHLCRQMTEKFYKK